MPSYQYKAKNSSGATVSGVLEAASRKALLRQLSSQRLRPLSISEFDKSDSGVSKPGFDVKALFSVGQPKEEAKLRIGKSLSLPFLQSVKEMLGCGIQAGDALRMMSTKLNDPRQKYLATLLWDDVRQGKSLSESFRNQSKVFDESAVNLIEAGEATGNLNNVLARIVTSMEEQHEIRSKLTAAMAYPLFLIFTCFAVVLIFLFYLLPRIQNLLDSLGSNLPLSTRIMIGMSDWMLNYGWMLAIAAVVGVLSLVSWRKTEAGRMKSDTLLLRVPGIGRFVRDNQILKVTTTLSLLLENGITMVQSLQMTEKAVSNYSMRESFTEAKSKVVEGAALSSSFKSTGYFDDMALDIFTVGENTGNVVPGLKQMAKQYNESINKYVKNFLGIMSIGVLLMAFGFVGMIAFGIISSVLQLSSSLSAG